MVHVLELQRSHENRTYNPPRDPAMKANPLAKALYFMGRTSDGIAWIMEIVLKVTPIIIPPPIRVVIDWAFAETTAPANAINGGTDARYLRSTRSERRPMMGDRTACMSRGAFLKLAVMAFKVL